MKEFNYDRENLNKICQKYHLKLVILHGSYAKETATDKSDIDIGVLGEGKTCSKKYFDLIRDLGGVFGDKVDPALLNGAEPMICLHVAMAGRPLFEEPKGSFIEFRLQSIARYMDTKKFRKLEEYYIKNAVAKGIKHD